MTRTTWNPENLKACLFDFGGTLDADGVTWQDRFYMLYRKHGIDVDREAFRQAFYRADDSLTQSCNTLSGAGLLETLETQAERVYEGLGLEVGRERLRAIVEDFLNGMIWYIGRNRPLLVLLGRRYALGIVSNFYGNLDRVCDDLGIRGLFSCIVDSSQEGVVKPDPRIFRAALTRMRIAADEAVFVGDSPVRDMEGAKGVGMQHILLAGGDAVDVTTCCQGDPVIRSLEALGPMLTNPERSVTLEVAG